MKADFNRGQKVSLFFYSEEDGKRTLEDKWAIELGKKYIIGRSKKKVDISIQDITISRVHSEFIFYDKDKIMIKDFNSSNGTYINKERIIPNKEYYFSIRDIISIGDEKNELVFAMEKNEEEEAINRNDFDKITETKYKNEEINQNKNKKNYKQNEYEKIKNEEKNNKYYNNKFKRSKSFHRDSSSEKNESDRDKRDNKYSESEEEKYDKKERYKEDKYDYKNEKYEDSKHKRKRNNYRSRSRSRSNSISFNKPYIKRNRFHRKFKKINTKKSHSPSSSQNSQKSSKKNKHKNLLSYIIKREEEIEKENDKRQIRLYNQYLKIKEEMDSKSEINNLPNLLPVLTAKSESYSDSYEENKKEVIRLSPLMRKKRVGYRGHYNKFDQNENKSKYFNKNKNSKREFRRKKDY